MREIITEKIEVGEHILIDGEEYVTEEDIYKTCDLCVLRNSNKCDAIPCHGVIFKKVKKEPKYRPYKDTDEMIADYKKRFNVSNVPAFCLPLIWVKNDVGICSLIKDIMPTQVVISCRVQSMKDLFRYHTYLDGSPCGKLEG